ncbi:MAG: undecaprenyldiphospho-muramoylpentapeptide beta-N-acetylglucosaminyltransferase [Bacillota bacterium]|uniref:UDP-N-acetylglucosamine--N-acetylmuramyl-(pentapeptide) pyrophosphoryl-undecaprenol N-acetylglucosamine transferase n=1 Tax=Thermanaerosceptrum fracticalcis TaxID=1712410 RepID=A0A7G6DZJ9_THEFR|nr:undecaprenyldiphospho-muramoylpentapeptide beta-N-acetylglucosaminyltransferase [Thermanaerosceptrum fracticalcis]QNB45253.1 undecaprenyldiphospho-muramoylpentapeptide beta-N-acetylglucosaminyltransferase [Thermanaerosceptrum fracticalcis]
MRVILTGGGTGGHIYPAIAIGQAILKEWPKTEILFVGTKEGLESKIVPETGLAFKTVDVEGWRRQLSFQVFKAGWKALLGTRQAARIIREFSPQIVIGTGGYVCLPVVWSAARQGIPTVIHEQNALPGLTNKFLSRWVERILLTFPESEKAFPPKVKSKLNLTGLPVRPVILQTTREEGLKYFNFSPHKLTLLGVGGSRGAKSINQAFVYVLKRLASDSRVQVIHITGQSGYEEFKRDLAAAGIDLANCGNITIRPYLSQMEYALACADLCVTRAGATFLAEMTAKGVPAVLIPYPFAAENHQEYNARALVHAGAAEMILDKALTGQILLKSVQGILFAENRRKQMAVASKNAGKPDATEKILQVIRSLV